MKSSSNPLAQIPSHINASHPLISFIDNHEDNGNPFVLPGDCFFHPVLPVTHHNIASNTKDRFFQKQHHDKGYGLDKSCDEYDDLLESVVYSSNKKTLTTKTDGHSKIYTAQGHRDRRVRLSIEISKKFFMLQDLLGYVRASDTIDWLFTKSRISIKELVEEKKHTVRTVGEGELAFYGTIHGGSDVRSKKMIQKNKYRCHVNLAKDQLRAEARARARERTKEKLRIKELKRVDDDSCFHTLKSYMSGQFVSQSDINNILQESKLEQPRFSVSSSKLDCYRPNIVSVDDLKSLI